MKRRLELLEKLKVIYFTRFFTIVIISIQFIYFTKSIYILDIYSDNLIKIHQGSKKGNNSEIFASKIYLEFVVN